MPLSSRILGTTPKNGKVQEPGFWPMAPGSAGCSTCTSPPPIRARTQELLDDPAELERILAAGAEAARAVAAPTLREAYERVGFLQVGVFGALRLRAAEFVAADGTDPNAAPPVTAGVPRPTDGAPHAMVAGRSSTVSSTTSAGPPPAMWHSP